MHMDPNLYFASKEPIFGYKKKLDLGFQLTSKSSLVLFCRIGKPSIFIRRSSSLTA